jgi:hypothetical protein
VTATDDAPERRSRLISSALRSLVGDERAGEPEIFPGGVALHAESSSHIWLDDRPDRLIAVAMLLTARAGRSALRIILPTERAIEAQVVARRATQWSTPAEVVILDGRSTSLVVAGAHVPERSLDPTHEHFVTTITAAGADVVVEHGVLTGEVAGLEVCRVVDDSDGARLEVGVGAHDREAFRMLHGETPAAESLARIVAAVKEIRAPGADPHPLKRLAPERALRRRLLDTPALVGAESLEPVPSVSAAAGPGDPAPAHLVGVRDGSRTLIACTTGTDLGAAADAFDTFHWRREANQLDSLVIAVPERNRLRSVDELAALSGIPTAVVSIPDRS